MLVVPLPADLHYHPVDSYILFSLLSLVYFSVQLIYCYTHIYICIHIYIHMALSFQFHAVLPRW